ncbi:VOC family protein [Salinimicrobium sp. GXAS 041]|uniref:VOC family protein n=1 Tax=Salinimicrobium sp. GXAS 041 TaxID=3400806 RepID=UPI003C75303F
MRIEHLKLYTNRLEEQRKYYEEVLELPVKSTSKSTFLVQLGFSVLEFQKEKAAMPYHIAFHIPAYKEKEALKWLKQRVEILKDDGEEIVDFPGWKAKSIYFYDADKNIVEFISRRHCFPSEEKRFSAEDMVGISEIGVATDNVKRIFTFLHEYIGLDKFTGDYERFCATGDDEGLFIVINKNMKNWIPTGEKAFSSGFEIELTSGLGKTKLEFKNDRLQLL